METRETPPRVVDTPEDLDALPVGAVAVDVMGVPWEKTGGHGGEWEGYPTRHLIRRGPLAVVRMPF